ncbi:hypothetical protein DPMN_108717 [Dreissena polymorpha]|uniref:Uncharacterized protein n=1 Tax=Dreissena polymorpha TaxID=45954 RepID=A0A9D4K9A3_DREPO|nr:hypothetical protein DPMN_108717 [Dreissena polymorpha]
MKAVREFTLELEPPCILGCASVPVLTKLPLVVCWLMMYLTARSTTLESIVIKSS